MGVTVFQRPACGAHLDALAQLALGGRALFGGVVQRSRQVQVTSDMVLQGLRVFGGHQMRQGAQLEPMGHAHVGAGQCAFLCQGRMRRFARSQETPRHKKRYSVEHGAMHGTLFLVQAPEARLARQFQQSGQRPQRGVQRHKRDRDQQHHQIERKIEAVRRPEQRDRALVAAGKQG